LFVSAHFSLLSFDADRARAGWCQTVGVPQTAGLTRGFRKSCRPSRAGIPVARGVGRSEHLYASSTGFLTILLQERIDPLFSDWPPERQAAALEVVNSLADAFEDTT
jgi:hypothetical protein